MTRRSSPRAQLRARFREMSGQGAAFAANTPLPDPPPQAGREQAVPDGEGGAVHRHTNTSVFTSAQATQATERARALYEDTAVPVREIARRCGVTERTILKYARKLDWKPRYHWIEGAAGERHRRWQPAQEFSPVKGAGARFVCREQAGQPFAAGLKALDPQADAAATAACEEALALARLAQADEQRTDAVATVGDLLAQIASWRASRAKAAERQAREEFRAATDVGGFVWRNGMPFLAKNRAIYEWEERAKAGPLPPDRVEQLMWRLADGALARWEALQAKAARDSRGGG